MLSFFTISSNRGKNAKNSCNTTQTDYGTAQENRGSDARIPYDFWRGTMQTFKNDSKELWRDFSMRHNNP